MLNRLFIREYVKKMTYDDVRNVALKNGIVLDNEEVVSIYKYIKNNYANYFSGNISDYDVIKEIKRILSITNYEKVLKIYNIYKDKI